ncbi:MAG: hypothetical protein U1E05_04235, partial [Patescibacteria group bacterium]|nr:hypothetical protein [Patescibacteria group bacterium]
MAILPECEPTPADSGRNAAAPRPRCGCLGASVALGHAVNGKAGAEDAYGTDANDGNPAAVLLREHRYFGRTTSLCPACGQVIGAKIVERDGAAYLDKRCPVHGRWVVLVSRSFDAYTAGRPLIHGRVPLAYHGTTARGCPLDCGYCPDHEQHACIGLIEVTGRCNMHCPTCYAQPGEQSEIAMDDFRRRLDVLEAVEGQVDIVQISGGE